MPQRAAVRRALLYAGCLAASVAVADVWGISFLGAPASVRTARGSLGAASAPPGVAAPAASWGTGAPPAESSAGTPAWARALLGIVAIFSLVLGSMPNSAQAEARGIDVYFGQGCFWHVQNELVNQEVKVLGRQGPAITALAGYAGGTEIGENGEVCYHNRESAPDYGQMGHTEVVGMNIPEDKVGEIGKVLLDYAATSVYGRHDPQDRGSEYRSAIGLPGGMSGPAFRQIEEVSQGKFEFVAGKGNDPDTVRSKTVWVYDTAKFPFHQGEIYHQFHDDMFVRYPDEYHKLREVKFGAGSLKQVQCPDLSLKS